MGNSTKFDLLKNKNYFHGSVICAFIGTIVWVYVLQSSMILRIMQKEPCRKTFAQGILLGLQKLYVSKLHFTYASAATLLAQFVVTIIVNFLLYMSFICDTRNLKINDLLQP